MVASPSPEYAKKLGETLYQMAGIEWLAIEVIQRLEPSTDITMLAGLTAHGIAEQLKSKVMMATTLQPAQRDELLSIANEYAELPPLRNDTAHARPATAPGGQQELYRWAPTKSPFIGFIDDAFLDQLLDSIRTLGSRLDATRRQLP